MYECILDTAVLNAVLAAAPDFHKCISVNLPETARLSRELRTNKTVQRLILNRRIIVHEVTKEDRKGIENLIRQVYGGDIANMYARKRMRHEAVEYECGYLAAHLGMPVYYFDERAFQYCHKLLKATGAHTHVRRIDDFFKDAPLSGAEKGALRAHILRMGYDLDKRK